MYSFIYFIIIYFDWLVGVWGWGLFGEEGRIGRRGGVVWVQGLGGGCGEVVGGIRKKSMGGKSEKNQGVGSPKKINRSPLPP